MLFNTLYFVCLPVGQVKPKNNLPEAISACLGQALISNPGLTLFLQNINTALIRMFDDLTDLIML